MFIRTDYGILEFSNSHSNRLRTLDYRRIHSFHLKFLDYGVLKYGSLEYPRFQWYSMKRENCTFLVARVSGSYGNVRFADGAW
jgi:hypothetical protein